MEQIALIPPLDVSRKAARQAALDAAGQRAQLGMSRAELGVEALHPGWCLLAVDAVRRAAKQQAGVFSFEALRLVIEQQGGLARPPELRVWGVICRRAAKAGFIELVPGKSARALSSNGAPKPAWKRGSKA